MFNLSINYYRFSNYKQKKTEHTQMTENPFFVFKIKNMFDYNNSHYGEKMTSKYKKEIIL